MSNEKFACTSVTNESVCPKLIWLNNSKIRLKFKGSCLKQKDKAPFTPNNVLNLFIVYELDRWSRDLNTDFFLKDCLFGAVKLSKNADPDKYKYSGYGVKFDSRSEFLLSDGNMGKNVIIFGADMGSSVHIDNKGKDILILGEGPTQGLDDTTLTAEAKYSINFPRSQRKFSLSLHYKFTSLNLVFLLMLQKCINSKQMILK